MKKEQIMQDLAEIMQVYKEENEGCYPLALEEAIREIKHGISSRIVTQYVLEGIDVDAFIMADEPEEFWEVIKIYDLDDSRECKDFFYMLWDKFGDKQAFGVLWELFTAGYLIDLDEQVKFVANWI